MTEQLKDLSFKERYGPWALITGASSGIGREFANVLAERGLNLILVARRKDRLVQMADELSQKFRVAVEALELDLAAPNFLDVLLEAAANKEVGLIVSNAGFGFKGRHHEQDISMLDKLINLNSRAPTLITRAFAPTLIKQKRGGIILTGSVEGIMGFPLSGAYSATKAYVHSLGEALWEELRHDGIDVLVLAPGATDTENLKLQGFDAKKMPNVMKPKKVVELTLDNISNGPTFIPGGSNRATVRFLKMLPRRMALALAAKGTKASMQKAAVS